jgi:glycosyltransferase involved in cell wall biosynthesis
MNISIIICCYNSANRIEKTLEHIAVQELNDLICEVLIVDNNCTDATVAIAQKKWKDCGNPFDLRIINEKEAGLSHARRAGVMAAKGEIVVFCDDDNWLHSNYCQIAYEIMRNDNTIGVLGGRSSAVADAEFPFWFSTYQVNYAVGVQSLRSGFVDSRGYLWGAGMVLRRQELTKLYECGFKSLLSDRKGENLSSGGDSEICKWFLLIGKRLYYSEELIFKHYIPIDRLTKEYFGALYNGFHLSSNAIFMYNSFIRHYIHKNKTSVYHKMKLLLNFLIGKVSDNEKILLEVYSIIPITFHKESRMLKSWLDNFKKNSNTI